MSEPVQVYTACHRFVRLPNLGFRKQYLRVFNSEWKKGLAQYKSNCSQLRTTDLEQENDRLRKRIRTYEDVISHNNLYILAAMNQADASVAPLDVAFMRRWQSYQLKPNYDVLYENFGVDRTQPISTVCSTASDVYSVAIHALEKINELICIGRGKEYQLGQGVFLSTKPKDNSMSSALQFASEAWSMIYAHIEELFFGDSISIGYLVNANSPLSPYKLEELYFAGETKFVLTCSDIDMSNIFNLYQAIAGRDQ